MEGGGDNKDGKVALRLGMDALLAPLKRDAERKALHWQLVCCGSRQATLRNFRLAVDADDSDAFVALLVDAEGPVTESPHLHLASRDRWDVSFVDEDAVHLMVQVMETWIVADADALSEFYGQRFKRNALPRTQDLESVSKGDIEKALNRATGKTKKGGYHKIRHARHLLSRIDAARVKQRCRHFERLLDKLSAQIEAA